HQEAVGRAPVDDAFDHFATTVVCALPSLCPPLVTVIVACHWPAIITCPGPRYTPAPAGAIFTSFCIVGIAAMKNWTDTSAPSIGIPFASFTETSIWLSPVFGGSGTVRKAMLRLDAPG